MGLEFRLRGFMVGDWGLGSVLPPFTSSWLISIIWVYI